MEIFIGWIFFLFGVSRLILANQNIKNGFAIFDAVRDNGGKLNGINYMEVLPKNILIYAVSNTIMMFFFLILRMQDEVGFLIQYYRSVNYDYKRRKTIE